MKIKVGDLEVHESGTLVIHENKSVVFFLSEQSDFILQIDFIDDGGKINVDAKIVSPNTILIIFHNFKSATGLGNKEPSYIGTLNHRLLFFSYRVFTLAGEDKAQTLHYTFFLGDIKKNG